MPFTPAIIHADFLNIAADAPGAVVSVVIGSTTVSAIRVGGIKTNGELATFGEVAMTDETLLISRTAYSGALPTPGTDSVTVDGEERLVSQVVPDAIGGTFQLMLSQESPNP